MTHNELEKIWWMSLVDTNLNCGDTEAECTQNPEAGLVKLWSHCIVSGSHTHQFVQNKTVAFAKHHGSKLYHVFRPPWLLFSLLHRLSRVDL